jgi:hypothetical protein
MKKYAALVFAAAALASCIHIHAPKKVVVQCKLMEPVKVSLAGLEDARFECTWVFKRK